MRATVVFSPAACAAAFRVPQLRRCGRICRIDQEPDQCGLRNQYLEQLQALRANLVVEDRGAGDVAAGLLEAGDDPVPDRIAAVIEDDRHCRRHPSRGEKRRIAPRDDDRHRAAHQILRHPE
jgi:hypothetical protein